MQVEPPMKGLQVDQQSQDKVHELLWAIIHNHKLPTRDELGRAWVEAMQIDTVKDAMYILKAYRT